MGTTPTPPAAIAYGQHATASGGGSVAIGHTAVLGGCRGCTVEYDAVQKYYFSRCPVLKRHAGARSKPGALRALEQEVVHACGLMVLMGLVLTAYSKNLPSGKDGKGTEVLVRLLGVALGSAIAWGFGAILARRADAPPRSDRGGA